MEGRTVGGGLEFSCSGVADALLLGEHAANSVSKICTGTKGNDLNVKLILLVREDKPNKGINSDIESLLLPFPDLTNCVGKEIVSNSLLIGRISVCGVTAPDMEPNVGGIP